MAEHEIKILRVARGPSAEPGRQGKTDRIYIYQADGKTVGFVRIPDEGFTDAALQAAIRKDLADLEKQVGATFKV